MACRRAFLYRRIRHAPITPLPLLRMRKGVERIEAYVGYTRTNLHPTDAVLSPSRR